MLLGSDLTFSFFTMDGSISLSSASPPCEEQQTVQNYFFIFFFIIKHTGSISDSSFKNTSSFLIAKTFQSSLDNVS